MIDFISFFKYMKLFIYESRTFEAFFFLIVAENLSEAEKHKSDYMKKRKYSEGDIDSLDLRLSVRAIEEGLIYNS